MRPHAFVSRLTLASVLGVATLVMAAQEGPPAGKVWVESKCVGRPGELGRRQAHLSRQGAPIRRDLSTGVVMKLTGTGNGGQLTLAGKGVEVKLKN